MRVINQETWPRRAHFQLYRGFEFPHVNLCVQVDITDLWNRRKLAGASPTVMLVYTITRAANRVPEFRQRVRGAEVIEHEVIHPLITVLGKNDLFGVITLGYHNDFRTFAAHAAPILAKAKESASLDEFPHVQDANFPRDDLLSITILPWLAFTGFAIARKPAEDCIPLVAFGKVEASGERWRMPFFANFHHALADGLHFARYVKYIQEEAAALAEFFGG